MFVLIIVLIIAAVIIVPWINPFLEYKKIGSYAEYKPVSKSLNDKEMEYSYYQINGFKNINQDAIDYLSQVSNSYNKDYLKWLHQCRKFIEEGLIKSEENDASKLFLSNAQTAGLFEILKVIKKSRKKLMPKYQEMGISTCGEAVVMHLWIDLRIRLIEDGEKIKPGDLDYVIDAVKEVKNCSI